MLENFPENDLKKQTENEQDVDSVSAGLQENTDNVKEDFRSLLNSNSRGKSDVTVENFRTINDVLNTQMPRKMEKLRMELISQRVETMNYAMMEKIFPALQVSFGELEIGLRKKVDLQSAGLDRNTGGTRTDKMALIEQGNG